MSSKSGIMKKKINVKASPQKKVVIDLGIPPKMTRSITTLDDEQPRCAAKPSPKIRRQIKANNEFEKRLIRNFLRQRARQRDKERAQLMMQVQEVEDDIPQPPLLARFNAMGL